MERRATRTFKTAVRSLRKEQKLSLQELGNRIDSDASHIFKIEKGQDITLTTLLKLAAAMGVTVSFGPYSIKSDSATAKKRKNRNIVARD